MAQPNVIVFDSADVDKVPMLADNNVFTGNNTFSGTSTFSASVVFPYLAITALRTLDATDYQVDCTANTFTVTLPTAVGITGRVYSIKNSGTGVITVATTSSQTIDGITTQTLNQYDNIVVMSNGANYIIL
jgi:hypothetical protein